MTPVEQVMTGDGITEQVKKAQTSTKRAPVKNLDGTPSGAGKAKGGAAAKTATKPAGKKSKAGSRPRYPEEITDAVRRAKQARGTTNGAPGAKQHVLTRKHVAAGDKVENVTIDVILAAAGVKTVKRLLSHATGGTTRDQLKELRPLGKVIPDTFCSGRNLASILVAWVEQIDARNKK